ncbi:MAG: hypothetical protein RL148_944 [Planctomycetota bacterium]|jgi:choice-of-anchor B domain-containing protein
MHLSPLAAACTLLAGTAALAQSAVNVSLVQHIPPAMPCATAGLWAMGTEYVLVGRRSQGFSVIDIRNRANPVTHNVYPPTYPRTDVRSYGIGEVKFDGRYIFTTNEDFYQGNQGGVFVYDTVPNPVQPTLVLNFQPPELQAGCHNLWLDGNWMYCVSDGTNKVEVYDITNRLAPVRVSTLGNGISGVWAHDCIVLDRRAYCSFLTGGFAIYDVTNPAAPVLLGSKTYTNPFTHNAWPSADRAYLYTTDENIVGGVGGAVRIWDIRNLPTITQVGTYKAGAASSIVHNVHVVDDLLYVSYYKEGVRVCSLRPDPTNPVEIAHYDTFPSTQTPCFPNSNYAGCWGVYPLIPDVLVASDMDNGVFLLNFRPVTHTLTTPTPNPVGAGQTLTLNLAWQNQTTAPIDAGAALVVTRLGGIAWYSPLLVTAGTLNPGASSNASWSTPVPPGLPPGLTIEFTSYSGTVGARSVTLGQSLQLPFTLL